jgi:hypothetical protein
MPKSTEKEFESAKTLFWLASIGTRLIISTPEAGLVLVQA